MADRLAAVIALDYLCPTCGRRATSAGRCPVDGCEVEAVGDDPLLGAEIGGYRVLSRIGEGGMGCVYKAVMPSIGAQVAIKVLSEAIAREPEMSERFVAEARISNLVRHDGLVNVLALGVLPDGRPYQIMEYLYGAPLSDVLRHRGALPLGTGCELLAEALRALILMHERGIVHRDLKPSNLYVTIAGRVKVIDFGIAKLTSERGLTRTGQSIGTPQYMAPEQVNGERVDGRSDLYALGIVLYQVVTGERPFEGRVVEALATRAAVPSVRDRVPDAPAALDDVIARATAAEPAARYATAAEMAAALEAIADALPRALFADPLDGVYVRPSVAAIRSDDAVASTVNEARASESEAAATAVARPSARELGDSRPGTPDAPARSAEVTHSYASGPPAFSTTGKPATGELACNE